MDIQKAHKVSSNHKDLIMKSKKCGCFYCIKTYSPKEIKEWVDDDNTALCPHCEIDAVLPEHPSYTLNKEFLKEMSHHWFSDLFKSSSTNS